MAWAPGEDGGDRAGWCTGRRGRQAGQAGRRARIHGHSTAESCWELAGLKREPQTVGEGRAQSQRQRWALWERSAAVVIPDSTVLYTYLVGYGPPCGRAGGPRLGRGGGACCVAGRVKAVDVYIPPVGVPDDFSSPLRDFVEVLAPALSSRVPHTPYVRIGLVWGSWLSSAADSDFDAGGGQEVPSSLRSARACLRWVVGCHCGSSWVNLKYNRKRRKKRKRKKKSFSEYGR